MSVSTFVREHAEDSRVVNPQSMAAFPLGMSIENSTLEEAKMNESAQTYEMKSINQSAITIRNIVPSTHEKVMQSVQDSILKTREVIKNT